MAEVAVNLQQPLLDTDVEDAAEDGLQIPAPRQQHSEAIAYGRFHAAEDGLQIPAPRQQHSEAIAHGRTKADYVDEEQSENTVYLDENGGAVEDLGLDMQKIVNAIQSHAISNGKAEGAIANREETGRGSESIEEEEVVEEEVVEVEFQNAIPKLHTHTMHCPNCNSHITKVVLRRKIIKQRPAPQITEVPPEPVDLLGCLSCFSLFTSAGNGSFNPFPLWRTTPASSTGVQPAGNEVEVPDEQGSNCFSTIRLLWKPSVSVNDPDKEDQSGVIIRTPPPKNSRPIGLLPGHLGGGKPETSIDIPVDSSPVILGQSQISSLGQDSKSFEILKSIVYGGLMEVIASLSIVASAAAADATTLSILSLALANLIGGIFIIGHNLWDLRNDCYRLSNEQTTEQTRTKYKELLGQIENFPLHMFFATLSFFVFGIIPPVAYGYAFYETSDKEFTLLVVLGVSVVCVSLLATFKAYVDRCDGFWGYVKTILYYVLSVVMVSGVSYAIGDLVTRVIEKLGLFETTGGADLAKLSNMVSTNTGFALY